MAEYSADTVKRVVDRVWEGDHRQGALTILDRVSYWGVPDIEQAVTHFREAGGLDSPIQDVSDDIRMATITDPFGNVLGLIQNPHFAAA